MNSLASRFIASHQWRLVLVVIVATMGLALVNPRPASVQQVPPSALASQFFNAIGGESPALMFSTNAVLHTPEGTFNGVTGPAQFGEELATSFSDVTFTAQSIAEASNGFLIATFTLTGINTGSYHGLAANCAGVSVQGVALLRVAEESVVDNSWVSQPRDQRNSVPVYRTVSLVTEQWVNYEANLVESQIHAFNEIDSNTRPGCSDYFNAAANVPPTTEPLPTCPVANHCELPY